MAGSPEDVRLQTPVRLGKGENQGTTPLARNLGFYFCATGRLLPK
jgi:hypothetical protein